MSRHARAPTGALTGEAGHADSAAPAADADDAVVLRVLENMRRQKLTAMQDPLDARFVIMVRQGKRGSLGAGRVPVALVERALALGGLIRAGARRFELATASPAPVPARQREADDEAAIDAPETSASPAQAARVNDAESVLAWLHRRKGPDGQPFLDQASFLAGERFRRDVTQASMLPSVTMNWSRGEAAADKAMPRDPAMASDIVIAARQRVRAVYRLLGSDMGNFMLDVCGFLVPLQEAEHRRAWPPRSGKLVLKLGLARLAAHYGIGQEPGGARRGAMSAWHAQGPRASIESWLSASD